MDTKFIDDDFRTQLKPVINNKISIFDLIKEEIALMSVKI